MDDVQDVQQPKTGQSPTVGLRSGETSWGEQCEDKSSGVKYFGKFPDSKDCALTMLHPWH